MSPSMPEPVTAAFFSEMPAAFDLAASSPRNVLIAARPVTAGAPGGMSSASCAYRFAIASASAFA